MVKSELEYVFAGNTVRPFLLGALGWRTSSAPIEDAEISTSELLAGGGFGVHIFATTSFSIDLLGSIYGTTGSIKESGGAFESETDTNGVHGMSTVGISGWLGGGTASESPHESPDSPGGVSGPEAGSSFGAGLSTESSSVQAEPSASAQAGSEEEKDSASNTTKADGRSEDAGEDGGADSSGSNE